MSENGDDNAVKYISLDPSFKALIDCLLWHIVEKLVNLIEVVNKNIICQELILKKYNVIIDGRNFYDNPIESDIEKYRELKKIMIGKGEDYTTGSLLDFN